MPEPGWAKPRALVVISVLAVLLGIGGMALTAPLVTDERARHDLSTILDPVTQPPGTVSPMPATGGLHGWGSEPRFIAGHLVVVGDGFVDGYTDDLVPELEWTFDECGWAAWATPVAEHDALAVVVNCDSDYVGIDPDTGVRLWTHDAVAGADRVRVAGASLITESDARIEVIDLRSGELRWLATTFGEANVSGDETHVYVSNDSGVYAMNAASGEREWFLPLPSSDVFAGSTAVYARTNDHVVVRLDRSTGAPVWRSGPETSRLDWSGFVGETDHAVVLVSRENGVHVTVYDKATGARLWVDEPAGNDAVVRCGAHVVTIAWPYDARAEVRDDLTGATISAPEAVSEVAVSPAHLAYLYDFGADEADLVVEEVP